MLRAFILLGTLVCARAITATCPTVQCPMVTRGNCNGTIRRNYMYCGCDICIYPIALGDLCLPFISISISEAKICGKGLHCEKATHTCQADSTIIGRDTPVGPCAAKLTEVETRLAAYQHRLFGFEKPHCDNETGDYTGLQFAGSKAYCVTKDGTAIPGYRVNRREMGTDMNCQCARDQYDYQQTGLVGKMFHCEQNGNYASMGCTGSVCYCQDKFGHQVGTSTVSIGDMGSLNC